MIRIVIADDHTMLREGIVSLLRAEENIDVVGEAGDGNEVLELVRAQAPDVVLMDIEMPGADGLQTAKRLRKDFPAIKILVLTMHNRPVIIMHMIKAGASGYLLKNSGRCELVKAIETVHSGETFFPEEIKQSIMEGLRHQEKSDTPLSSREIEIIKLIANEMTTTEIANALHLSPMTVETHRKNIFVKLGLRNVAGLIRYAFQKGWID